MEQENALLQRKKFGLALSDEGFRELYLSDNRVWWEQYFITHQKSYQAVLCNECSVVIPSSENLRLYQEKAYCPKCFSLKAIELIHHLNLFHELEKSVQAEWMLRVAGVMDGGLMKVEPKNYIPPGVKKEDTKGLP